MNTRIPKNPAARWIWIKAMLEFKGTSLARIAGELNVSRQAVSKTRHTPYPKMERAIACKLGVDPDKLWPERYAA